MKRNQSNVLDITQEVCPMTFVKTRLFIEHLAPGDIATIRLSGEEPLENIPISISELGHAVIRIEREEVKPQSDAHEVHQLIIRKN
tara:strand:- start:200 stop:457 length:258 start_codon:yes stop_codon:yes gene_type:complete